MAFNTSWLTRATLCIPAVWMVAVLGLILGGAIGNVIDRVVRDGDGFLRGRVIDFIDFQWWPVFNVADIAIVVGGVLLVTLASERRSIPASQGEDSSPVLD